MSGVIFSIAVTAYFILRRLDQIERRIDRLDFALRTMAAFQLDQAGIKRGSNVVRFPNGDAA